MDIATALEEEEVTDLDRIINGEVLPKAEAVEEAHISDVDMIENDGSEEVRVALIELFARLRTIHVAANKVRLLQIVQSLAAEK